MAGRQCHHCKQWIEQGEAHDCWTTTESALTRDLPEDLREAWARLRETAAGFGQQRIYASGHAIMFARKACYFFVRPKKQFLEVCVFLGRTVKAPQVRLVGRASKSKLFHLIRITHRDQVEAPVTSWLREAYEISEPPVAENNQMAEKRAPGIQGPPAKKDDGTQLLRNLAQRNAAAADSGIDKDAAASRALQRVRLICSSIPGTVEKISHGEPTFFTPKRVFAMFANNHHGDGHVAVWVPAAPGVQAAFIEEAPETYFRPPYVGVAGWVGVELSRVDDKQLGAVIREAFRLMTAKTMATNRLGPTRPDRAGKAPRRPRKA